MPLPQPGNLPTQIFRAVFIALGLGLVVSGAAAWQGNQSRAELERIRLPTGLGMDDYVKLPEPLEFQSELGKFGGLPIYAASLNIRTLNDAELEVLYTDLPGELPVFRRYHGGRDIANEDDREFFLKVGPGQYLRVHQGPDHKPFAAPASASVPR